MEKILIVDDDKGLRYALQRMFEGKGKTVLTAKNGKEALDVLEKDIPDLVLMDIIMPGMNGIEVLKEIKKDYPKLLVIIMTAFGTTETAIEAMRCGAYEYILKPFDIPKMWDIIEKALSVSRTMKIQVSYKPFEEENPLSECIVGKSAKMQEVYKMIGRIAESDVNVLLRGESGTGKELVARAIYQYSRRAGKPFIPVNCAAIPDTLLESELFGHERGAFTGAENKRIGKFEQCNGGTIFLDEIGDMSLLTQAKILRVVQEKEIQRVGGTETIKTDVRLIVATNKDLEKAISEGKFRDDLYYRLNVVTINLPALKERKEDIGRLVQYFIRRFNLELKKDIKGITSETLKKLEEYSWPGNVRELENIIKRAVVESKSDYIMPDQIHLDYKAEKSIAGDMKLDVEKKVEILLDQVFNDISRLPKSDKKIDITLMIEKLLIKKALRITNGNQVQAAALLGMNRNTIRTKIEKYKIKKEVRIGTKE
jgi:nitrogen regulation protein NR(I)